MRPRYFRDGTVLLRVARRWVGKARVRSPPPRASAPATPTVPGLDSAWEGTANPRRPCQTWGLCDVGRCLQRTRVRPRHLLWPKPEKNPECKSALGWKCRPASSQSRSPTATSAGNNKGRQVYFVGRAEYGSLLCFGNLCRQSLS